MEKPKGAIVGMMRRFAGLSKEEKLKKLGRIYIGISEELQNQALIAIEFLHNNPQYDKKSEWKPDVEVEVAITDRGRILRDFAKKEEAEAKKDPFLKAALEILEKKISGEPGSTTAPKAPELKPTVIKKTKNDDEPDLKVAGDMSAFIDQPTIDAVLEDRKNKVKQVDIAERQAITLEQVKQIVKDHLANRKK